MQRDLDKWAQRRAARRAVPARPEPVPASADEQPIAPRSLYRAFSIWVVVGAITALGLVGIIIIAAAFNLNAGYRGARVMLTVIAVPSFLIPIVLIASGVFAWPFLITLALSGLVIAATILMWRPEVTEYFRTLRG